MKIVIRQRQKGRKYSLKTLNKIKRDAKTFCKIYPNYLNHKKIKKLELIILNHAGRVVYGSKNKPMIGFESLYCEKTKKAKIYLYSMEGLDYIKDRLFHEVIHLKQRISKEMVLINQGENIKWKGRVCHAWKTINWDEYDKSKEIKSFLNKLPWEREVFYATLDN